MKFTALLLAVALSGCASTGTHRTAQVAFVGTQILDITSTRCVLANGGRELNPIAGASLRQQVLVKGAAAALILSASAYVRRQGHPKAATALLTALSAGYAVIVIRNYRLSMEGAR